MVVAYQVAWNEEEGARTEAQVQGEHSGCRQGGLRQEVRPGDIGAGSAGGDCGQMPRLHALAAHADQGLSDRLLSALAVPPLCEQSGRRLMWDAVTTRRTTTKRGTAPDRNPSSAPVRPWTYILPAIPGSPMIPPVRPWTYTVPAPPGCPRVRRAN